MIFTVPDISCNHCKKRIEDALSSIKGVEQIAVNIHNKTVEVSGKIPVETIKKALHDAGYPVKD